MGKEYQEAWDQVTLSSEADERIRRSLMDAQRGQDNVITLHKEAKMKKTAGRAARTALIAAMMVLALSVTAFAAANYSGFFRSAFGNKGFEDTPGGIVGDDIYPAHEWGDVDEETAAATLGEYVSANGNSVTARGYTLTVEDVLIDDNGVGAISYTISNPDGLPDIEMLGDYAPGQFNLGFDWLMSDMMVYSDSGITLDHYNVLDAVHTTDTQLHAIFYFQPLQPLPEGDTLYAYFNYRDKEIWSGEIEASYVVGESDRIEIPTDNRFPCSTFVCGDDVAHLSPVSLFIDVPDSAGEEDITNYWAHNAITDLAIKYADGSVYTVYSQEPHLANTISGGISGYTGQDMNIFNRFVDVDNVTSFTCIRADGTTLTFTPGMP